MTPSTMFLLTFFLCPTDVRIEAMCGPSTGQYGPYATVQACEDAARMYLANVKDVPILGTQWHVCRPVGMGMQR
jgi:hypothetical protein